MSTSAQVSVSSAEFVRHFGRWQDHAARQPVTVTHHGRGRVILVSAEHYDELTARPGRALPEGAGDAAGPALVGLIDHIDQGFISFDHNMIVRAVNRAACCYLKTERDVVVGHTLDRHLPGIEETFGYASLARAAASGGIATFEMPSFVYEGRWLLFTTFPHANGVACLFRDISDEMEIRHQVHARAAMHAALEAHLGIGRAKLSVRGTFSYVDSTFAGFAEFSPEGLAHARLRDIIAPRHRAQASEAIEKILEGGAPQALELGLLTKSGAISAVRLGIAPLSNQTGPAGAAVVITAR